MSTDRLSRLLQTFHDIQRAGPTDEPFEADDMTNRSSQVRPDDAAELQEILNQAENVMGEYGTVLAQVRIHQDGIARERAELGDLRERLVNMRGPVREWERRLWKMGYRDGVSRESLLRAENQIRTFSSLLDELIWQLFDFRKKA